MCKDLLYMTYYISSCYIIQSVSQLTSGEKHTISQVCVIFPLRASAIVTPQINNEYS